MLTNVNEKMPKNANPLYCDLWKKYKQKSLSRHKKQCNFEEKNIIEEKEIKLDLYQMKKKI